jgi:putative PIN family toxin of toxin-antitoxin system
MREIPQGKRWDASMPQVVNSFSANAFGKSGEKRVVIDTNLIIASRFNPRSASSEIIEMCCDGTLQAVYSPKIKDENLFILEKVRPDSSFIDRVIRFYANAMLVRPEKHFRVCMDDRDDDKYFDAAIAGNACIISNDHHLLDNDGFEGVKVFRSGEFLRTLEK